MIRFAWMLGLSSLVTAACGFPPAPAYPHQAVGFKPVQIVEPPGMPGDQAPALTLQPGDTISIESRSDQTQEFAGLVIDATGQIHLPLAGDIVVGRMTVGAAEQRVQEELKKLDRFVQVTLRIVTRAGQRATVLGAVNTQGSVELIPGARVTDVIAGAGGPITAASGPNPVSVADLGGATLMRGGRALPISMPKALRGDPLHNVYVHPGDHLYVPPASGANISILGQVGSPVVLPHRDGLRLTEALTLAGGITVGGDKGDIRVIRGSLERPLVYAASLSDIVDGDSHDVLMAAGDIVFVADHPIEDFGEVMGVISPALSLGLSSVAIGIALDNNSGSGP